DADRAGLLERAVAAGADYVDIELDAPLALRRRVVRAARRAKCQVIASFHDFAGTPERAELERIVRRCFAAGADIAKVACTVSAPEDAARLLGLLGGGRPLVVVGMGPRGRLVRIAAPLLGGLFTYAAPDRGRPTAPGQLRAAEAAAALEQLRLVGKRGRR
ncbi:MAG: type I 3-dehydroquinate dehydratase, partial [Myxococcales bacterium]